MKLRICAFGILVSVFFLVVSGCNKQNPPYDATMAEELLSTYSDDINIVNKYLMNNSYNFIYINSDNGCAYADFEDIIIEDHSTNTAIHRLFNNAGVISIDLDDKTIDYTLWIGHHENSCGIAYSIGETDTPQIQYAVKFIPLSEQGWYYYLVDYNEWRVGQGTVRNR